MNGFVNYINLLDFKEQKMTAEKEAELKSLFNSYDDNGDNCISPGELKQAFLKLGQEITDEEIEDMVSLLFKF